MHHDFKAVLIQAAIWDSKKSQKGKILTNDICFLIDKSKYIINLMQQTKKATLFLRPPGFGKTFIAQMLSFFLSATYIINRKECTILPRFGANESQIFFTGGQIKTIHQQMLKINALQIKNHKCFEKYYANYPVLYLSLKEILSTGMQQFLESLKRLIRNQYILHRHLLFYHFLQLQRSNPEVQSFIKKTFQQNAYVTNNSEFEQNFYKKITNNQAIMEKYIKNFPQLRQFCSICINDFGSNDYLLEKSLTQLIKLMVKFYKRSVIVILDDFDANLLAKISSIRNLKNEKQKNQSTDFIIKSTDILIAILKPIVKQNVMTNISRKNQIQKVFFFGITDLLMQRSGDALSSLVIDSQEDTNFPQLFGFSQAEIQKLVINSLVNQQCHSQIKAQIKIYYGGYTNEIFNPQSVLLHLINVQMAQHKYQAIPEPQKYCRSNDFRLFLSSLIQISSLTLKILKSLINISNQILSQYHEIIFQSIDIGKQNFLSKIIHCSLHQTKNQYMSEQTLFYLMMKYGFLAERKVLKQGKSYKYYYLPNGQVSFYFKKSILMKWAQSVFQYSPNDLIADMVRFFYHYKNFQEFLEQRLFSRQIEYSRQADFQGIIRGLLQIAILFHSDFKNVAFAEYVVDGKMIDALVVPSQSDNKTIIIHQYKYGSNVKNACDLIDFGFRQIYINNYIDSCEIVQRQKKILFKDNSYKIQYILVRSIAFATLSSNTSKLTVTIEQHKYKRSQIQGLKKLFSIEIFRTILEQNCKDKRQINEKIKNMNQQQIRSQFLKKQAYWSNLLHKHQKKSTNELIQRFVDRDIIYSPLKSQKKAVINLSPSDKNHQNHLDIRKSELNSIFLQKRQEARLNQMGKRNKQ